MAKSSLIGRIAFDLVANTGKLLAPVKKAQGAITGLMGTAARVTSIAAPITGLVGGFVSAGVAIGKVTKAFGEIGAISDEAARLGIGTEKLIGLQHAAGLAGVESETLGKSLQFLMKSGGDLKDLDQIADTIANMSDPTERMQYAIEKFGKGGAGMINMLMDGSDGLKQMQEDAEKLGLTLNDTDAAKVEMAGDAFDRIGLMFDGVARKLAVELAPFVKYLADSFVEAGTKGEGMGGFVRAGVDMAVTALGWMLDAIDLIKTGWAGLQLIGQLALTGLVDALAWVVKGAELAAEGIASGFSWAWSRTEQVFTEGVGWIITKMAELITWIESYLPDSMQTGLGAIATEFAKTYDDIAAENRKAMESQEWKVDLNMGGDTARAFADNMLDGAKQAKDEFLAYAGRDKMSEGLKQRVEDIRNAATDAAKAGLPEPGDMEGMEGTGKQDVSIGALERGSAAAMSAITATQKTMSLDQQNLEAQKRHTSLLDRIEKNTRQPIAAAGIA